MTSKEDSRVFLVKDGKKQWVPNAETIASLGFDWNDIQDISPAELKGLSTEIPLGAIGQQIFETPELICCIEKSWSDNYVVGLTGWVVGKKKLIKDFKVKLEGVEKKVTHWIDRPEVQTHFAEAGFKATVKCGFQVAIQKNTAQKFGLSVNGAQFAPVSVKPSAERVAHAGIPIQKNLDEKFRKLVNDNKFSVLEVGSRISPGGVNKRTFFKNAGEYVGMDYKDGKTVDVVGDAHELSKLFPRRKFDALYSDSVLEHLAAPWKAVIEMNKVLKKGGYVYHSAPSSWPLHDMPWDFWRFSDAGFKALFSEAFGFRVLEVGYTVPMSLHIDYGDMDDAHATLPLAPAYGFVSILAQKTHNVNPLKTRFTHSLTELVDKDTTYPAWTEDAKHN